jgi:SAM-dependent MidA family methyltransferase
LFDSIHLHLVERSARARSDQPAVLGDVFQAPNRECTSAASLPATFEGVLLANELLDAMPVHQVVMREDGLREVYVDDSLRLIEGPPSTPALERYLDAVGVTLEPGWRVEINLAAVEWIRDAARRLRRGFLILIDYGHEARELYSATHSSGTLTAFSRHRSVGPEDPRPAWLQHPGRQDLTAHVDFTSVRAAAESEGMTTIGFLDQTYFLMGLLSSLPNPQSAIRNPHWKTLVLPGGLGSTHKVLILGKQVGRPAVTGCSFSVRVT